MIRRVVRFWALEIIQKKKEEYSDLHCRRTKSAMCVVRWAQFNVIARDRGASRMILQGAKFRKVLNELNPIDAGELSILKSVLSVAQSIHRQGHVDLSIASGGVSTGRSLTPSLEMNAQDVLRAIPEDAKSNFYGLVEALDIYKSIHGTGVVIGGLQLGDKLLNELRQIRDLCVQRA